MLGRSGPHSFFSEMCQGRRVSGSGAVQAVAWLAVAFVVSRVGYAAAGVGFDASVVERLAGVRRYATLW